MIVITPEELAIQSAARAVGVTAVIVGAHNAHELSTVDITPLWGERIRQLADEAAQLAEQFDANLPQYPKKGQTA